MSTDTPAYYYHPDAHQYGDVRPIGRRIAGSGFFEGFVRHMPGDRLRLVATTLDEADMARAHAHQISDHRPIQVDVIEHGDDFTTAGAVFLPGPSMMGLNWLRYRRGARRCSLIGITHTVSTRRAIESLNAQLIEPTENWDAVICTSAAVHAVAERAMDIQTDYLRRRFAPNHLPRPTLPVLPLGVDTDNLGPDIAARAKMRRIHGAENALVIATVGRFSSVEKAHPAPLFLVLEQLAQAHHQPIQLWMTGWAARDEEHALHKRAAESLCPSVTVRFLDGQDTTMRHRALAGADIFTLPIDSIQETFGLVALEAMAMGLPVVMPDWDGIRDTVRHGETGLLIPTRIARAGSGQELADRFAHGVDGYLQHLSLVQQQVAIDLPAYLNALTTLAQAPQQRATMGAAGQEHVRTHHDWAQLMPQYAALADELEERRRGALRGTARHAGLGVSPHAIDPFDLFRGYASHSIGEDTIVTLTGPIPSEATLSALDAVSGRDIYGRWIAPNETLLALCEQLGDHGMSVQELRHAMGFGTFELDGVILWLAKVGIVQLSD